MKTANAFALPQLAFFAPERRDWKPVFAALCLFCAAVLVMWNVFQPKGFYHDEFDYIFLAKGTLAPSGFQIGSFSSPARLPLVPFVLFAAQPLGTSYGNDLGLKVVELFFAFAALALIFLFAREVGDSQALGGLAALLLASNYLFLQYSGRVLTETALVAATIGFAWACWRFVAKEKSAAPAVAFAILGLLTKQVFIGVLTAVPLALCLAFPAQTWQTFTKKRKTALFSIIAFAILVSVSFVLFPASMNYYAEAMPRFASGTWNGLVAGNQSGYSAWLTTNVLTTIFAEIGVFWFIILALSALKHSFSRFCLYAVAAYCLLLAFFGGSEGIDRYLMPVIPFAVLGCAFQLKNSAEKLWNDNSLAHLPILLLTLLAVISTLTAITTFLPVDNAKFSTYEYAGAIVVREGGGTVLDNMPGYLAWYAGVPSQGINYNDLIDFEQKLAMEKPKWVVLSVKNIYAQKQLPAAIEKYRAGTLNDSDVPEYVLARNTTFVPVYRWPSVGKTEFLLFRVE